MRGEYNVRERSKKIPHKIILMNTVLEKVLIDKTARESEELEMLALAQDPFESWG